MLEDDEYLLLSGERWQKFKRGVRKGVTTGEQECYAKRGFKAFKDVCEGYNDKFKDCVGGKDEGGTGTRACDRKELKTESRYKCTKHAEPIRGESTRVCEWRHVGRIG